MTMVVQAKTVLIGVDGFSQPFLEELRREGRLPAFAALARSGVQVPLISTIPATTPVAWASIATGAPPSVTGIEGFLIRVAGKRLDERVSGCYAHRCKAEPLWETARQSGLRSYVVKFPLSYPSKGATFRLDGAAGWGGLKCFHEIASTSVASTDPDGDETRIRGAIVSGGIVSGGGTLWRGEWELSHLWGAAPIVLDIALRAGASGPSVSISSREPSPRVLATLEPGQWTEPLTIVHAGRRGPVDVSFRLKLLSASVDPPALRLFNTPLHERTGHSAPEEIWESILASAGPIEEQSDPSLMFRSQLDLATQLEIFRLNVDWLERVASRILRHEPWDLVMLHTHVLDWGHHLLQGAIDPRHPAYDAATAPLYREHLAGLYERVDAWIGSIAQAAGPDANLVVLGDHGQDVVHTSIHLNDWLAAEGLLRRTNDGDIDWSDTKALAAGNYIYVNTEGRDEGGIVPERDAAALRDDIVRRLHALTDPRNGAKPVLHAGPKAAFSSLGADGAGAGDVIVCFASGYQATNAPGEIFEPTIPFRAFTSNHDHYWPHDPAIQTRLYASGPSFRSDYVHPRPASVIDVAPTLSAALGIPPPRDATGRVIDAVMTGTVIPEQPNTTASATWQL